MFNSVFGAISADLAIDLGTSNTRISVPGRGLVISEPTVVAVQEDARGERQIVALGAPAEQMRGRAPRDVRVVSPVRGGAVADYEVVEAMVRQLVVRVQGRRLWVGPRVAMTVPYNIVDIERPVIRKLAEAAGAREVLLVPGPLASAIGAGLPVAEPRGHMVVDIGGGGVDVCVVSMGGIVDCRSLSMGGEAQDEAIIDALRERHRLVVGRLDARRLKHVLGSALAPSSERTEPVWGRHLDTGFPQSVDVRATELHDALHSAAQQIARLIVESLEQVQPELASDVAEAGVVLTGGGALLHGLDTALGEATGMTVVVPEDPVACAADGAARILADPGLRDAISMS